MSRRKCVSADGKSSAKSVMQTSSGVRRTSTRTFGRAASGPMQAPLSDRYSAGKTQRAQQESRDKKTCTCGPARAADST